MPQKRKAPEKSFFFGLVLKNTGDLCLNIEVQNGGSTLLL
jgi:hypothetical protein